MRVRISATDWAEGGTTGDDAVEMARMFADHGVDIIDVSTGQVVAHQEPGGSAALGFPAKQPAVGGENGKNGKAADMPTAHPLDRT